MSKVVKGAVNAVKSVVQGVVKVVKGVASGVGNLVKSIAKSKLGKAIVISAAVYFGGAALAGGFGSSAAGGSFLTGMGKGVGSAASTLSSAWGSLVSGNFGSAASQIGGAWGAAGNAASGAVVNATPGVMTGALSGTGAATPPINGLDMMPSVPARVDLPINGLDTMPSAPPWTPPPPDSPITTLAKMPPPDLPYERLINGAEKTTGIWDRILSSPYTAPALISGGMQLGGNLMQAAAQGRQAAEARARYQENVGTNLGQYGSVNPVTGEPWDPVAAAREYTTRYGSPPTTLPERGLIGRVRG